MFCPKCGNEVQEGSSFCGNCGAGIAGKAPNTAGVATAAATIATTKAGKKKGPIAIAAAVVVVILAVIVGMNAFGGSGVEVKSSTEAYTWEELSKISDEIGRASDENAAVEIAKKYNLTTKDGKLDGTQTKSVTLTDGTRTAVQIAGFAHDEKTDGGKAGITFIFKDCIGEGKMNPSSTNAGGWEKSEMRSYLNSEGLNLLPADLKQVVISVNKLTNNIGRTNSMSSVTKTSDKLWLFSLGELAGETSVKDSSGIYAYYSIIYKSEGSEYKLFTDLDVNINETNSILAKSFKGSSCGWWERSPDPQSENDFWSVITGGAPYVSSSAYYSDGVCPGFCI